MSLESIRLSDLEYKHAILEDSQYTIRRDVGATTAITPSELQPQVSTLCGMVLFAKHTDYEPAAEVGMQYISTALGADRTQQILKNSGSEVQGVMTKIVTLSAEGSVRKREVLNIHDVGVGWADDVERTTREAMGAMVRDKVQLTKNQKPSALDAPVILLCIGALIFTKLASTVEVGLETAIRRASRVLSDAISRYPRMDIPRIAKSFFELFEKKVYYRNLFIEYGKALGSTSTGSRMESLFVNIFMQAYGAGQTMLRWGVIARSSNNIMLGHVSVQAELRQVSEVYDLVRKMGPESGLLHLRQSPKAGLLSLTNCPNFASVVLGNAAGLGIIGMYKGRAPNLELFAAAESYARTLRENNKINLAALGLTDDEREAATSYLGGDDERSSKFE
ncbi:N [avian metapneumovirus]|uniref:Nucleoprotein n=1 Tax=avian metapneumovirus TaxID=38525 RepID=Q5USA7_9MONO|nr:N [Avian metapneumovirus] [Avian metapneumovirus]AAT68643.1 N [Avian metapneumovirus] [Avian metapneumovirus]